MSLEKVLQPVALVCRTASQHQVSGIPVRRRRDSSSGFDDNIIGARSALVETVFKNLTVGLNAYQNMAMLVLPRRNQLSVHRE
jgi:hypothetical protein